MNRKMGRYLPMICSALLLAGCAGALNGGGSADKQTPDPLAASYRQRAQVHEKRAELPEALLAWRVVALLEPGDVSAARNINNLEQAIEKSAQAHFERGEKAQRQGNPEEARREWLIVLRLQPGHPRAAELLRRSAAMPAPALYQVQAGDSLTRIAARHYGDAGLSGVIAQYNDLDPHKSLPIGKTLRLPVLDREGMGGINGAPALAVSESVLREQIAQAMVQQRFDEAVGLSERLGTQTGDGASAHRLVDEAHYRWGLALIEKQQYSAAAEQLRQVRDGFKGRDEAMATVRKRMQREAASEKLKSAEAFMSRRDYDNALKTVAEIIAREPDHAEAQVLRDAARYGNGRRFLDKNQDTEALREFGALKPTYQDTAQLMALARGRLAARAESHYRSGVKHFLNEELEKAVAEWEKTLALNPEHRKARQDMENAQRLLDKLRGLEKK